LEPVRHRSATLAKDVGVITTALQRAVEQFP
jgi:hypothetical protein